MDIRVVFDGTVAVASAGALIVAILAWFRGRNANRAAGVANEIAERAVREAARSADAAEGALTVQRREAGAAEQERAASQKAEVIPVCWDSRGTAGEMQGVQIRNHGPAIARDVVAVFQHGGGFSKVFHHAIGIGETLATRRGFESWDDAERATAPVEDGERRLSARAWWKNADDTDGDSGWLVVPRF